MAAMRTMQSSLKGQRELRRKNGKRLGLKLFLYLQYLARKRPHVLNNINHAVGRFNSSSCDQIISNYLQNDFYHTMHNKYNILLVITSYILYIAYHMVC